MTRYLNSFPKPFLDDLVHGRCVPFIGAGFSKNAKMPRHYSIPDWNQLGSQIHSDLSDYQFTNPLDSISAYIHEYGRVKLVERLFDLLNVDKIQPDKTHFAFCRLPFELVVTTNFEFLIEQGYETIDRFCLPILSEDQLSVDSNRASVKLVKLHGDLNHPIKLVITEEDYDSYIDRNPLFSTFLANLLISKTPLFIGYSLDDPDFRQIWQVVKERLGKLRRPAYTLVVNPSTHIVSKFERRGVKVIAIKGDPRNYPEILTAVFQELNEYWSNRLIELSTTTDRESTAELALPRDAKTRICFFSVPHRLSSFYREAVFPIAEKYGFSALFAVDVLAPGENIMAKVAALIDKSQVIVVDINSPNTLFELQMIKAKEFEDKYMLVISDRNNDRRNDQNKDIDFFNPNMPSKHTTFISRPSDGEGDDEAFLIGIENWFKEVSDFLNPILLDEPERLLKKKEYRAAVISAISLLEHTIKIYIEDEIIEKYGSSYRSLKWMDLGLKFEFFTYEEFQELKGWTKTRNKVVHSSEKVDGRIAGKIVRGVMKIVRRIRHSRT